MIFDFKNIGIIEYANIELKGLTVLTGVNDTGKSFLGKSVFSIIKTINEASDQQKIELSEKIQNVCNLAFAYYRQAVILPKEPQKLQQIHPQTVSNEIIRKIQSGLPFSETIEELTNYKNRLITEIISLSPSNPNPQVAQSSIGNIENQFSIFFKTIGQEDNSQEYKFRKFFNEIIIKKLFQNQYNGSISPTSEITIKEGQNELVKIIVRNNSTETFQISSPIIYKDATLIETPTILQLSRFIFTSLALGQPLLTKRLIQQRSELPYHYYDLIDKFFAGANDNSPVFSDLIKEISGIINGQVVFDPSENNFVYLKNNKQKIKGFNIASGIKSFGLIQLLLNSHYIDQRSLLIIDEPEVHLHPNWELEYANIIVQLSKAGIPIMISTHSPLMLQAIPFYINKYGTNDITKFYFGERDSNENSSRFIDVTNNLEPIFSALAKSMGKLL